MVVVDQFVPTAQPPGKRPPVARDQIVSRGHRPTSIARQNFLVTRRQKSAAASRRVRIVRALPVVLVLLVLSAATGMLLVCEIAIAVYAILAVGLRYSSRTSFKLALLLLLATILLQLLAPSSGFAENCAVYAFLFVVVGTISLAIESHRTEAPTYSLRHRS